MRIVSVAARPHLADILAPWHFAEWAHLYVGWTFERCRAELQLQIDANRLPTTLVAVDDAGEALGSVSLLPSDLPGYECFSPWLASLFVRPDHRRRGLGGELLEAAIAEARRLGIAHLYLFSPAHESYYAARGWLAIGYASASGHPVTIMCRTTGNRYKTTGTGFT